MVKDFMKERAARYNEDSFEAKLICAQELKDEETKLKRQVKKDAAALHMLTKQTIESLTDEHATELLREKWIAPLTEALNKIPEGIVSGLISRVRALAEKYAVTYAEVAGEIAETKSSLSVLLDELTGNEYDMKGIAEFKTLLRGE